MKKWTSFDVLRLGIQVEQDIPTKELYLLPIAASCVHRNMHHKLKDLPVSAEKELRQEKKKVELKYTYKEGQWSPINLSGKKQYDRNFLIQFQPECTDKPVGLPDIPDIVLNQASLTLNVDTKPSKGFEGFLMPKYMMKSPQGMGIKTATNYLSGGGGYSKRLGHERGMKEECNTSEQRYARDSLSNDCSFPKEHESQSPERHGSSIPHSRENGREDVQQKLSRGEVQSGRGRLPQEENVFKREQRMAEKERNFKTEKVPEGELPKQEKGARKERASRKEMMRVEPEEKEADESAVTSRLQMSQDEFEGIARRIVKEYIKTGDGEEAVDSLTESGCPQFHYVFVCVAIENTLRGSSANRERVGQLFSFMLARKVMTFEEFSRGLNEELELAVDMAQDVPSIWMYLGEIVGTMTAEEERILILLKDSMQLLSRSDNGGVFVAEVLRAGLKLTNREYMKKVWENSKLRWNHLIPKGRNVHEIVLKDLDFTSQIPAQMVPRLDITQRKVDEYKKKLIFLMKIQDARDPDNSAVIEYIENTIETSIKSTMQFLRALVQAICLSCILKGDSQQKQLNPDLLKKRAQLMQRYIGDEDNRQLQALHAVQALNVTLGNPPFLLRGIFDVLYDEYVILEETFFVWRENKDPPERVGKDEALQAMKTFFDWLEESDEETP